MTRAKCPADRNLEKWNDVSIEAQGDLDADVGVSAVVATELFTRGLRT